MELILPLALVALAVAAALAVAGAALWAAWRVLEVFCTVHGRLADDAARLQKMLLAFHQVAQRLYDHEERMAQIDAEAARRGGPVESARRAPWPRERAVEIERPAHGAVVAGD